MIQKFIQTDLLMPEAYPDPIQEAKRAAISARLADNALAGDMPASRLFSNLPAAIERDVWQEVLRERKEMSGHSQQE